MLAAATQSGLRGGAGVLPEHPVEWAGDGFLGAFRLKQRPMRTGVRSPRFWSHLCHKLTV